MKKFNISVIIILLMMLSVSCSSDSNNEGPSGNDELARLQNESENRNIPVSELNAGVIIEGATIINGTPPAPTNTIDLQIESNTQEAFQENGFSIKFSSDDTFSGAYILLLDADGNKSDSYFEVSSSSILDAKSAPKKTSKGGVTSKINKLNEDDFEIEVDFSSVIKPGKFCYEICLFDENGNVSSIESVCVEVEAWGGNSEIVGEWRYDRDNASAIDDTEIVACDNGETIEVNFEGPNNNEEWILVLNADGTYYETYIGVEEYLDFTASRETCTAQYISDDVNDKFYGNWAYNEDLKTLTIIDFGYENNLDPSQNEIIENGSVYFDGNDTTAEVVNNELVITENYFDGSQNITYSIFFKRK